MRVLLFILVFVFTVSAQDHFSAGTSFAEQGDCEKALDSYRAALKNLKGEDTTARAHYNIGVSLYHLGRHAEAAAEFRNAIEMKGGKYQRAWYALGMAESALGNNAGAKKAFTNAIALNKRDAEAWFDLGMILINEKDYTAALSAFENAAAFGSVSAADAQNNIGVILALNGDVAAAITKFEISGSEEAIGNLRYCREHVGNVAGNLVSMLEFARVGSPRVSKGTN
jgi:tetratricopeptide (TPR) repeat protein